MQGAICTRRTGEEFITRTKTFIEIEIYEGGAFFPSSSLTRRLIDVKSDLIAKTRVKVTPYFETLRWIIEDVNSSRGIFGVEVVFDKLQ